MLTVRNATRDDLPKLVVLLSQLHPDDSPLDGRSEAILRAWQQIDRQPHRAIFIAEHANELVGTIDYNVIPNLTHNGRPYAIVENFVVGAAHRRRGFGKALLEHAVEQARHDGCYKVQLQTNRTRGAAHAFYESQGFTADGVGYRRYGKRQSPKKGR
jgi:GNAT superfamily N-acetyltransferase